ncbi:MAG TPA: hypothetical protein VEY07_06230 [Thermoplasmata archaeon]|nr:hypothetical protein [Thermoplasmata archaeon]
MHPNETADGTVRRALEEERALVATLGGFTLEIAGGRLVTNERIPVPRFNFIQEVRVSPARQAAFFEKALDHYFQRALRPTIRVVEPVPAALERSLASLGFRPLADPHLLLVGKAAGGDQSADTSGARPAHESELEEVIGFWSSPREREELRRAVEVAWTHPNPDEQLVPFVVDREGLAVAALVHRYLGIWGIHSVATQPVRRGRGLATALVQGALRTVGTPGEPIVIHSDSPRLADHLGPLGFQTGATFRVFELPSDAELALPRVPPDSTPRWRPPRGLTKPD